MFDNFIYIKRLGKIFSFITVKNAKEGTSGMALYQLQKLLQIVFLPHNLEEIRGSFFVFGDQTFLNLW